MLYAAAPTFTAQNTSFPNIAHCICHVIIERVMKKRKDSSDSGGNGTCRGKKGKRNRGAMIIQVGKTEGMLQTQMHCNDHQWKTMQCIYACNIPSVLPTWITIALLFLSMCFPLHVCCSLLLSEESFLSPSCFPFSHGNAMSNIWGTLVVHVTVCYNPHRITD